MLTDIKHCDKNLNFAPLQAWSSSLPAIAFKGELWSGFELPEDHPVYNWTSGQALQIFKATHPQLSMVEVARICQLESPHLERHELLQVYGLQPQEGTLQILKAVTGCPEAFQTWLAQKAVGPQELGILLSLAPVKLTKAFHKIVTENHSRSHGVQILELFGELLMMGKSEELLLSANGEAWVKLLRQLRYPLAHSADQTASQAIAKISWPGSVQSKWTRRGDQAGIELKFFAANPLEFKRTLASLRKLEETFGEDNLW